LLLRAGVDTLRNRAASNELGLTAGIGYDLGFSELNYAYSRDRQALAAVFRFGSREPRTARVEPPTGKAEGFQANEEGAPTLYQAVPAN
jgi:hypothetical protein